jgi:hypothetical protein
VQKVTIHYFEASQRKNLVGKKISATETAEQSVHFQNLSIARVLNGVSRFIM